ncbi:hypothetical protein DM872_09915 [Pseudomonas taiwanensis]|uniref:autotransporter family protein n=1 Tax=Pseudomonas taiwanensis TaxID=470150 RepID=UPI0015BCF5F7|nr:autotransporter domain-containing protein [Pseudomonas taiwanensis]NWL77168.1 hypothetical protein [Pseudomonas taiwanensis]
MPDRFTQHYLAIAIATALLPTAVQASTVLDISNSKFNVLTQHYDGDLRLVGSITSNADAATVLYGSVAGNLVNDADMFLDGSHSKILDGTLFLERGSHVGGNVVNNASLITSNIDDANVSVSLAQVDGQFINKGLIEQSNQRYPDLPAVSVYVSNILGGFTNEGTISASGPDTATIEIINSRLGSLSNSGLIQASGSNSIGLHVWDDVILENQRIDNTGTISATDATGAGAIAVRIDNGAVLNNFGTIRSDNVAVEMTDLFATTVQHEGMIEAPVAFRGTGTQQLDLIGGSVHGDLDHLRAVRVYGNSTLDASRIDTNFLNIIDGKLTLTRPHGTLTGSLYIEEAGQLELMLNTSTDTARPYLDVQGSVYAGAGASVLVTPTPNDFSLADTQRYQLVQASNWYHLGASPLDTEDTSLTSEDFQVVSTSGLLQINRYSLDNGILSAEVAPLQGQAAADLVAYSGASLNAQNAMLAFSTQLGQLDSNDPVFQALANSDTLQTTRIAEQLSPEANGVAPLGALDGLRRFEASLLDRPDSSLVREGVQPWVQVIGSKLKSGTRQGVRGFDLDNRGIAVGIDWGIGSNGIAGLAYGHYRGDASSHNGNKLDSRGHLFGLFGNHHWGRFFVSGDLTLGWLENDHRRYIAGTRAKGEGDGREFGATLLAGYRFPMQDSMTLEPRVAARYSEVRLDGYSEKGSSAALRVNSTRYQSGELGAGLKLTGRYAAGPGTLLPEATLMGWYDNVGDRTSVTSTFLNGGTNFATRGVVPGRDSYEGTLGLRYQSGALTLGTGYSYTLRNDANARTAYASMSFAF